MIAITNETRELWLKNKAPKWLHPKEQSRLLPWKKTAIIDSIINQNNGIKFSNECHNTVALVRAARRHEPLVQYLIKLAANDSGYMHGKERAAWCKRWLRKLGYKYNNPFTYYTTTLEACIVPGKWGKG